MSTGWAEPNIRAAILVNRYGLGMALRTARHYLDAFKAQDDRCAYWAAVTAHLMALESRRGKPHTKAQKRRLRVQRQQQREARA